MSPLTPPSPGREAGSQVLSEEQLRRSVWIAVLAGVLLPPLLYGGLMGVAGFYPAAFYGVFLGYAWPYLLGVLLAGLVLAHHLGNYLVALGQADPPVAELRARCFFSRLPWWLLGFALLYGTLGSLGTEPALKRLGFQDGHLSGYLDGRFGAVPVVLVTMVPIFIFFTDRVGRYLAPRGVSGVIVPLGGKLIVLGIVTPLLIDILLIGHYINETGHFVDKTAMLWGGLLLLATAGTWMAWRSLQQALLPMRAFLRDGEWGPEELEAASLKPLSLDEVGVLTSRFASLLRQQQQLSADVRRAQLLCQAVIDHAGVLVVVLDRAGRMVRFNHACERLSGYTAAEMLGRFIWDTLLPPEEAATIRQQAFDTLLREPQTASGHYTNHWIGRDDQRFLIEWFNTVLLDAHGAVEFIVAVGVDVTERQRMEAALNHSQETYARAEAIAHIGSWEWDIAGDTLRWSDEIFRIFGQTPQSFGATYEAFLQAIHPDDRQAVIDAVDASLADPARPYDISHRVLRPDGSIRTVHEIGEIYRDQAGKPLRMIGTVQDVTEAVQKDAALRESERKYRRLHESMTDAFAQVDMTGHLVEWNPAFEALLGYGAEELRRLRYVDLTPPKWQAMEAQIIEQQVLLRGYSDVYEKEYLRQDGKVLPVELRTYLLRDDAGVATGMWAIVRDISERKASEARVASLAYFDPLTSLPNRVLFADRLLSALALARRDNRRAALLFVDLDKFKPVNDTYGHAVGDQLLQAIAQSMRDCVRESDTVGRIGGDEFVVLLPEINSAEDALAVAEKIHQQLRQPITVGVYRLEVSSSIGVAIFPEHGHDDVQLMRSADNAMYRAKETGRDRVVLAE